MPKAKARLGRPPSAALVILYALSSAISESAKGRYHKGDMLALRSIFRKRPWLKPKAHLTSAPSLEKSVRSAQTELRRLRRELDARDAEYEQSLDRRWGEAASVLPAKDLGVIDHAARSILALKPSDDCDLQHLYEPIIEILRVAVGELSDEALDFLRTRLIRPSTLKTCEGCFLALQEKTTGYFSADRTGKS